MTAGGWNDDDDWNRIPLEVTDLSIYTRNALRRAGLRTLEQVANCSFDKIAAIPNIGSGRLVEINKALLAAGLPALGIGGPPRPVSLAPPQSPFSPSSPSWPTSAPLRHAVAQTICALQHLLAELEAFEPEEPGP